MIKINSDTNFPQYIEVSGLVQGDTIQFQIKVNQDISNWDIRAELFDQYFNSVKIASVGAGGSTEQVDLTNAATGIIILTFAKGTTDTFWNGLFDATESKCGLEVRGTDPDSHEFTLLSGVLTRVRLVMNRIKWNTP